MSLTLLLDSNDIPLPQAYSSITNAFEKLKSANGGMHVVLYDYSGNPLLTSSNPGYTMVMDENGNVLTLDSNGKLPVVLENSIVLGTSTASIGRVTISSAPPAGYCTAKAGKVTVSTAGTAVSLGSQALGSGVTVIANPNNTGYAYVFPSAGAKASVIPLKPGDSIAWPVSNLSALSVDADNSGSSVYWQGAV